MISSSNPQMALQKLSLYFDGKAIYVDGQNVSPLVIFVGRVHKAEKLTIIQFLEHTFKGLVHRILQHRDFIRYLLNFVNIR